MTDFFNAFEMSPVPDGPDAVAPEPYRGIYAMPMFVNVPTNDLEASTDFWVRGLGFINLFSVPGQVVHLRRWAFQDVLLVPAGNDAGAAAAPSLAPMSVSFSCVLGQLESVAAACRELSPDSVTGPYDTPWRTRPTSACSLPSRRASSSRRRGHWFPAVRRNAISLPWGSSPPTPPRKGHNDIDGRRQDR